MKKPQSVYLAEEPHARLSTRIDNALDGHGSLAGFFEFFGRHLATFGEAEAPTSETLDRALTDYFDGAYDRRFQMDHHGAWRTVAAQSDWLTDHPVLAHILALYALKRRPGIAGTTRPATSSYRPAISTKKLFRELAEGRVVRQASYAPIWKRNKLDVVTAPNEPSSTSFYLENEHHSRTVELFGRDLYQDFERCLLRTLDKESHWVTIEAAVDYLEHGQALFEYETVEVPNDEIYGVYYATQEWIENAIVDENPRYASVVWGERRFEQAFSWELITSEEFARYGLSTIARLGREFELFHTDLDMDMMRERLPGAFANATTVTTLLPDRKLAFKVLQANRSLRHLEDFAHGFFNHAREWHTFELFKQYALEVLPEDQRDENRVSVPALATLAQPWVFKTKSTLAAYASANVTKDPDGTWRILKGRKTVRRLSDKDAYTARQVLNTVLTVLPCATVTPSEITVDEDGTSMAEPNRYKEVFDSTLRKWDAERVDIPLSPEVIDLALELAQKHPDPIEAGLHLIGSLADTALKAEGKFHKLFLSDAHAQRKEIHQ